MVYWVTLLKFLVGVKFSGTSLVDLTALVGAECPNVLFFTKFGRKWKIPTISYLPTQNFHLGKY